MKTPQPTHKASNGSHDGPSAAKDDSAGEAPVAIEITKFTKDKGPLTKRISLGADGKLVNDSGQCRMARGTAERLPLSDWRQFADILSRDAAQYRLRRSVAYARIFPIGVKIVVLGDQSADLAEGAARSKDNIRYEPGRPGLALLDHDTKGMPTAVRAMIDEHGRLPGRARTSLSGNNSSGSHSPPVDLQRRL